MRKITRSRKKIKALKAIIEAVERRTLLSGAAVANGVLTVTGTNAADVILVNFNLDFIQNAGVSSVTGTYTAEVNGVMSSFGTSGIKTVVINGQSGNDTVDVQGTEQDDDPDATPVGVAVDETDGNDSVEIVVTGSGIGAPISDNVTVGNGNDNVFVQGGFGATVSAGNGDDTLSASANNTDLTGTFHAGNGNDEIDGVSAGDASLRVSAVVGTGHDTFNNNNDPDISVAGQTSDGQSTGAGRGSVSLSGVVDVATSGGSQPLAGATVFLDANENGVLDSGDLSATTNTLGAYMLNVPPLNGGDPSTYDVRVVAPGYASTPLVRTEDAQAGDGFSGDDFALAPIATATSPVLFGMAGSYNNQGNTIANAVDGNLSTFFDSPTASGGFVALDYGLPQTIKQISFSPRSTLPGRMVGGLFQGSNSSDFSNAVTLYTVTTAPAAGKLTTVNISNTGTYRYVRYLGPANSYCNIAEIKFTLATSLTGAVIGTAGSYHSQGNTAAHVFDGNLNTFFDAPDASGDWAGLDLGTAKIITQISYAPRSGWASRMVGGMFQASNSADFSSGVATLYTVTIVPTTGVLTTVQVVNFSAYRYVRYIGPANSFSDIAEAQFSGSTPVVGSFVQSDGTLVVNGTNGADNIHVTLDYLPGTDSAGVAFSYGTPTVVTGVLNLVVNALGGDDYIYIDGESATAGDVSDMSVTINGGDGNDTLTTNVVDGFPTPTQTTYIDGGGGDDTIKVHQQGFATLIGGDGNDIFSSDGNPEGLIEAVYGGEGNDALFTDMNTGYSIYDGGAGINTINTSQSNDNQKIQLQGANIVNVHNVIAGGTGSVSVIGSDGADTITVNDLSADDVSIQGGGGGDLITVFGEEHDVNIVGGAGNNTISVNGAETANITGGADDDTITVSNSQNVTVNGGAGDDVINVRGNVTESVDGGPGFDTAYTDPGATVVNVESLNPGMSTQLTGTLIGTSGSYHNQGNTAANAFDGNLNTFFDGPDASGDWVGLDLGTAKIISQISFAPRGGLASRMVGGMFQASNTADFSSGVVTLYTVTAVPAAGVLTTVQINNTSAYRYVRYIGPANSYCNVAEMQFFGVIPPTVPDTSGNLDVSFGDGEGYIAAGMSAGAGNNITVLPNGQFLVVSVSGSTVVLQRYNSDGTIDSTFGVNGVARPLGYVQDMFVQSSGDIVIAGGQNLPQQNYIERLLPNGAIDTSFGSQHNGIVLIDFGNPQNITVLHLLPLPNGQFVLGGTVDGSTGGDARFALERFNANGTVDNSFGGSGTGIVTTDVNPSTVANDFFQSELSALALTPNGEILAAGSGAGFDGDPPFDSFIARYTANGILDTSFGQSGTGIVVTSIGQDLSPIAIRALANGQFIVAGGHLNAFGAYQFGEAYALRYNADGSLDPTYSQSILQPASNDVGGVQTALIYPDGSVLFAGDGEDTTGASTGAVLFRLTASGEPDTNFNGGSAEAHFVGASGFISAALTSDSRILAMADGTSDSFEPTNILLVRYLGGAAVPAGSSLSSNGTLNVTGSAEGDVITVDLSPDGQSIIATVNGQANDFPVGSVTGIRVDALGGDDSVAIAAGVALSSTVFGGDGNDTLSVSGGNDTIYGNGGNDAIFANDGSPTYVNGGTGDDTAVVDAFDTVTNVESYQIGSTTFNPVTGTIIGTAGSYRNHGTTIANVFDSNLSTYFDGPDASGDWVGLDLGFAQVVTTVRYAPRAGWESRMVGGEIQASNTADFSSGVVTLLTIDSTPTAGVLTTQSFSNSTAYRYYRYIGPANSYCDIAELEFDL